MCTVLGIRLGLTWCHLKVLLLLSTSFDCPIPIPDLLPLHYLCTTSPLPLHYLSTTSALPCTGRQVEAKAAEAAREDAAWATVSSSKAKVVMLLREYVVGNKLDRVCLESRSERS